MAVAEVDGGLQVQTPRRKQDDTRRHRPTASDPHHSTREGVFMPTSGDSLSHNDEHKLLTPVLESFLPSFCSGFSRAVEMVLMAALLFVPVFKLNSQTPAEIITNSEVQATWQAIKTDEPHLIEKQIRRRWMMLV
jgi:hypothetical protein